jgi:hypothetical protein
MSLQQCRGLQTSKIEHGGTNHSLTRAVDTSRSPPKSVHVHVHVHVHMMWREEQRQSSRRRHHTVPSRLLYPPTYFMDLKDDGLTLTNPLTLTLTPNPNPNPNVTLT